MSCSSVLDAAISGTRLEATLDGARHPGAGLAQNLVQAFRSRRCSPDRSARGALRARPCVARRSRACACRRAGVSTAARSPRSPRRSGFFRPLADDTQILAHPARVGAHALAHESGHRTRGQQILNQVRAGAGVSGGRPLRNRARRQVARPLRCARRSRPRAPARRSRWQPRARWEPSARRRFGGDLGTTRPRRTAP